MSSLQIASAVFACTFGGALAGMWLRTRLPDHHLSSESRDSVKVGIGLVATITALVLGLVTASAKSSFDSLDAAVKHVAGEVLSLDRSLAQYGVETQGIRAEIKKVLAQRFDQIWSTGDRAPAARDPGHATRSIESSLSRIRGGVAPTHQPPPHTDRAVSLAQSILDGRWTVFVGATSSIPTVFLATLVFWLTVTFASYGLLAPRNATVISTLLVCALSVAGAVFLILEMGSPFEGVIRVSPEPIHFALEHMGK